MEFNVWFRGVAYPYLYVPGSLGIWDMCLGWRIVVTEDFMKKARRLSIWDQVKEFLMDLARLLEEEPSRGLSYFLRQPIVYTVYGRRIRRLRMGDYRLFYFIEREEDLIVFVDVRKRRETRETYREPDY